MIRAAGAAAAALAVLAGCSTLPPLGECGNGIVEREAGEACDGETALCADCRLACVTAEVVLAEDAGDAYVNLDPEDDGSDVDDRYCPAGHGCGADGVCRAPAARFRPAADPVALESDRISVGDVDDDDVADVIAVGDSTVRVLYGAALEDAFGNQAILPGPIVTGRPFASDLDRDGSTDLLIPSLSGLIRLMSENDELTGALGVVDVDLMGMQVDPTRAEALVALNGGDQARVARGIGIVSPDGGGIVAFGFAPFELLGACVAPGAALVAGVARRESTGGDQFAVGFDVPGTGAGDLDGVCLFVPDGALSWNARTIRLASGDRIDPTRGHPVFARVDDLDQCPQLLVPIVRGANNKVVAIHGTGGAACDFAATAAITDVDIGAAANDKLFAAGDIVVATPALDELITSGGIARREDGSASFEYVFRASLLGGGPFADAIVGDVDGDTVPDAIASRLNQAGMPDNDLAVVLTRPGAVDVTPAFNPVVVDTLGAVRELVGGDFDANGAADAAFVEDRDVAGAAASAVSVLFGNVGALPDPPLVFDTLDGRVVLATVRPRTGLAAAVLESDALDDLGVVQLPAGDLIDHVSIGIAFGTAQRFLSSPQWFGPSNVSLVGAIAGDFGVGTPDLRDVAVFARGATKASCATGSMPTWYWPDGAPTSGCDEDTQIPASDSLALAVARDRAGGPVIVGGTDGAALSAQPWGGGASSTVGGSNLDAPAYDLVAADVDANAPGDELIAAFGRRGSGESIYLIPAIDGCTVPPFDQWIDLAAAAGHGQGETCAAAVALPPAAGADPGWGTIVAACRDQRLVVLRHVGGALVAAGREEEIAGVPITAVRGDFTADGVDDIAVVSRLGGVATLSLFAQCAVTDVDGDCATP